MRSETEVLTQVDAWAQGDACVRAVILNGSRADSKTQPDFLSDYDLVVYVTNLRPFQESDSWLQGFGSILVRWPMAPRSTFDSNWLTRLVLFEDDVRIDFQITEARDIGPSEFDNGYRVITDKDGMTRSLNAPTFTEFNIKKPLKDEFEDLVNEFWWDAIYVPKQLCRNELPFAKYMLDNALRHTHLHRMIEWYIGSQHDWSVNPGCHGKWFSRYLDTETWTAYKNSYAGFEIEKNWRAFFQLAKLFGRLAAETAEHLGYPYTEDLGKKVTEYAARLRQTDGELR
ncbi:MAG: aminoglycoside 6-adenylyltransferase [Candidatus Thiodiazotropha sp.]